jgi:hypothetical protein
MFLLFFYVSEKIIKLQKNQKTIKKLKNCPLDGKLHRHTLAIQISEAFQLSVHSGNDSIFRNCRWQRDHHSLRAARHIAGMTLELQGKWGPSLAPNRCSIGGTTFKGLHVMDLLNIP